MPQVGTELKNALGTGRVRETRRADQKQGLPLGWTAALQRRAEFLEFHPALLLGRRFQAIDVAADGVFDFAARLRYSERNRLRRMVITDGDCFS